MKKKNKKQKRVLVASLVLAAIIVAGGTFAWFTSKDEVTNKLSASNKYDVTITETFTPPSQWVPGEDVTKEVGVVNTGNVDAFVKLQLKNAIDLTVTSDSEAYNASNVSSYVELSADKVKSLQAGGYLVCKAGTALTSESDMIKDGTGFTPDADGLYVFRRNVTQATSDTGSDTYEYAGYYYVASSKKYYKITDLTLTSGKYDAKVAKTKSLSNKELTLDFTKAADKNYVIATYAGEKADSTDDDIVIYINLASDWQTNWTLIDTVFYYNKILEAGNSTGNLVTSVTLSEDVKDDAYESFDYYLTVTTDSAQVSNDTAKTTAVNAQGWKATAAVSNSVVTWTAVTASNQGSDNSNDSSSTDAGSVSYTGSYTE
jgi:predicted ribosomally synthesized peptide with SipW-like signal peptide